MKVEAFNKWRALVGVLTLAGLPLAAWAQEYQQLQYRVIYLPDEYVAYDMNEAGTHVLIRAPYEKCDRELHRPAIGTWDENGGFLVFATLEAPQPPPEITYVDDIFFQDSDPSIRYYTGLPVRPAMSGAGNAVALPAAQFIVDYEGGPPPCVPYYWSHTKLDLFSIAPFSSTGIYRNGWGTECNPDWLWPDCPCYHDPYFDELILLDINSGALAVGATYTVGPDSPSGPRWLHAAVWPGALPTILPGQAPSEARAINEVNRIVGCVSDNATGHKACIWNGASVKSIGPDVFPSVATAISPTEPTCVPPGPDGDLFNSNVAITAWIGGGYLSGYLYNGNDIVSCATCALAIDMTDTGIVLNEVGSLWAYTADRQISLIPCQDPACVKYVHSDGTPDESITGIVRALAVSQHADVLAEVFTGGSACYAVLRPMSTNPAPFRMNPGNPSLVLGVIGWRSLREHTGIGELSIDFSPGTSVKSETRNGGIKKIAIDFDRAAYLVPDGCPPTIQNLTTLEYVTLDAVYFNADKTTLFIDVSTQTLPDETCYRVSIAGAVKSMWSGCDPDVTQSAIRGLVGDVNSSGEVTTGDMAIVKMMVQQQEPVTDATALYDINCSGEMTTGDSALVRMRIGNSASCP